MHVVSCGKLLLDCLECNVAKNMHVIDEQWIWNVVVNEITLWGLFGRKNVP
jgi:hypothetical protein